MRKIGITNYRLPERKATGKLVIELLPHESLLELCSIATEKVVGMTLRSVGRAEIFEARHPFWNSIARCYVRIIEQFGVLQEQFPGITRVIHASEIIRGDILVSDFSIGLNFGSMDENTAPVKIRVLEVNGEGVKGEVLQGGGYSNGEVLYFWNEIWFFISHRFEVISGSS
jgi:hypothetical protein